MSDTTPPPPTDPYGPPPFDPSTLAPPEDAPMPGHPVPDHNANGDPIAVDNPPEESRPFTLIPGGRKGRRDKPQRERDVPKKRPGQLVKPLTELYTSMGAVVSAVDPVCGLTIVENAGKCAESLDALAQRNEAIRRALYAMMETSAWGGVMMAHLPLLAVLMVHHGPRDVADRFAPIAAFTAPNAVTAMQAEADTAKGGEPA